MKTPQVKALPGMTPLGLREMRIEVTNAYDLKPGATGYAVVVHRKGGKVVNMFEDSADAFRFAQQERQRLGINSVADNRDMPEGC